ncbi:MAG: hypothetical protein VXW22_12255, partial [Pseudomonadota bacterium]|nr:hypothetical protein [Pseudomonadota bacterium]
SPVFARQVVGVFTQHVGQWAFPIIAVAAFAAIYGTFITSFDAFGRSITGAIFAVRAGDDEEKKAQVFDKTLKFYPLTLSLIALYIVFIKYVVIAQLGVSMGEILRITAIIAFLCSPIIAFLNFRAVMNNEMPEEHKPKKFMQVWSWVGLAYISIFAIVFVLHRIGVF